MEVALLHGKFLLAGLPGLLEALEPHELGPDLRGGVPRPPAPRRGHQVDAVLHGLAREVLRRTLQDRGAGALQVQLRHLRSLSS